MAQIQAQPRLRTPEIYLGAHGGATASTVLFNPSEDYMTPLTNACSLGWNGGLVFRYTEQKYCALQVELNYLHRGWGMGDDTMGHTYYHLHYIEIPMLMNLHFGSDICQWFFNLGPQIGYCFKDETHTIEQPFDWGVAAGTGLYFPTRKAGVYQIEVRFDFSFGGIYGTKLVDKYSMASPMDLSVNFGWLMPVRSKRN